MIGLLGTVSGMISAFQTIGQVGMGDPSALAGDIGEALITTATGLTIGIPAMVAYFIFRNKLNAQVLRTVESGGDLIDAYVDREAGRAA
jgi:biopolymer transport protein ExbB